MKRLSPAFVLLVLSVLCLCATAAAGNLLKNSDFSARAGEQPAEWKLPPGDSGWSLTDADGHSGQDALRYQRSGEFAAEAVTQEAPCQPNTEYVLSAWLKGDGTLLPLVRVIAPDLGSTVVTQVVSDGAQTWTRFATRFNSGQATRLIVQIFPIFLPDRPASRSALRPAARPADRAKRLACP